MRSPKYFARTTNWEVPSYDVFFSHLLPRPVYLLDKTDFVLEMFRRGDPHNAGRAFLKRQFGGLGWGGVEGGAGGGGGAFDRQYT